jgi:hypothetical protein
VAEERNPLSAQAGSGADPAVPGSASDDPTEIRAEIDRTRAEMGQTIDEIKERLDPERLKAQAKQTVHDATVGRARAAVDAAQDRLGRVTGQAQDTLGRVTVEAQHQLEHVAGQAQDAASALAERVRERRVPAALIGAGMALLLVSRAGRRRRTMFGAGPAGLRGRKRSRGAFEYRGTDATGADGGSRLPEYTVATYPGRSRQVAGLFREHPIPTSLVAAAGLGWLLMNRRSAGYRYDVAWPDDPSRPGAGGDGQSGVGRVVGGARDTLRDAASRTRHTAGSLAGRVGDSLRRAGEQVRSTAGDLTGTVQERWETVRDRAATGLDRQLDTHPLALGAAALAAGAIVGLAAPRSEVEDEYLGQARDTLVDSASSAAEQAGARVREAAEQWRETETPGERLMGGPAAPSPGSLGSGL